MSGLQSAHTSVVGDAFKVGLQNFVDQSSLISVPYTAIVGRAQIPDLANDLKASGGIERIQIQQIVPLQNEFGASGEPVYGLVNDDRGLVRFVGSWQQGTDSTGTKVNTSAVTTDYAEITFYGTDLNLLMMTDANARNTIVYVDGGSASANIYTAASTMTSGRNYAQNCVIRAASNLTLGIHTVKIQNNSASFGTHLYGFEILNSNASGLININAGTAYIQGQKVVNLAADSIAYNTGVTGTKGGRIVRYLGTDGNVSQAFQATDSSAAYYPSANHTNEEFVRLYNFQEFGAARNLASTPDDFSTPLSGTDRAFTLDDGTTTLLANAATGYSNGFYSNSGTGFIAFMFVGTGLDIQTATMSATTAPFSIIVDGTTVASNQTGFTQNRTYKIASGLPYGTHVVKFLNSSTGSYLVIKGFSVYQPKKPAIPAAALELCDYNVMANYSATNSAAIEYVSQGTLRKTSMREIFYDSAGSWSATGPNLTNFESGFDTHSNIGSGTTYAEYTFFGTGCDFSTYAQAAALNITVSVDGSSALTGKMVVIQPGALTVTPSAGTIVGTASPAGRVRIQLTGFTLGIHKVRLTWVVTAANSYVGAVDVITPIHSYKNNLYADYQNTLPVGSNSLMDSRKTSMLKEAMPSQKAWAQATGLYSGPTISNLGMSNFVPCPDMSLTIKTQGNPLEIFYSLNWSNSTTSGSGTSMGTVIYVDGAQIAESIRFNTYHVNLANFNISNQNQVVVPMSAGVHKVDLYWSCNGAGQQGYAAQRLITAREI